MSNFLSGGAVECGPSTALKDVSKLVDRDYGVQRDRYVSHSGPSGNSNVFHPQSRVPQEAAPAPNAFDVSQLRSHLPPTAQSSAAPFAGFQHQAPVYNAPSTAHSKGKERAAPVTAGPAVSAWGNEFAQNVAPERERISTPSVAPWQRPAVGGYAPMMGQALRPQHHIPRFAQPQPIFHSHNPVLTPQFAPVPPPPVQVEPQAQQQQQPQHQEREQQQQKDRPQDELARTAQALVDQLGQEHSTNDKLHNSQFVQLLRGLGEGSVVVQEGTGTVEEGQEVGDGAKFVAANGGGDWASAFLDGTTNGEQASTRSPAHETHPSTLEVDQDTWADQFQSALTMSDSASRNKSVHFDSVPGQASFMPRNLEEALQNPASQRGATSAWEETMGEEEDYDDFDTDALRNFNGPKVAEVEPSTSQHQDWLDMQDWSAEYDKQQGEEPYLFHSANPYAMGSPIVRELSPTTMGLLELEAAVQQDPRDATAWLALGLKQQENEREDAAIRALAKATELAPETRAAYLALAVSYTNEGRDANAFAALEKWIELGSPNGVASQTPGESREERQSRIVDSLIQIAVQNPDDVDADVQVALGVLFNSSEDYSKAEDCFTAALEARPDDWVLYNRLGATLANSGRSHEAIKYYHRALALHPNFVRAQFNLGISYINLAQYRLAAQCILDAIRLQHADVTEGYGAASAGQYTKGVTPDALWTTLRMACLHLQRPDLVNLANHHDLSGFPFEL